MAQATIENHTACEYQVLFANDESFRPLVTPIIKATFDISSEGKLTFAKEQIPVNLDGAFAGDPENSSYVYEPECAFMKPTTDVVVIGDAVSPQGPVSHLLVDIQVGSLAKKIGVIGNRQWLKQAVGYVISEPERFERMALTYENAFGGWDRRHPDVARHDCDPRNSVGKGYYCIDSHETDAAAGPMLLPNLENPDALIRHLKDRPEPVACGFTLPHWSPRAAYAGTYDQTWLDSRSPLLPADFDRRFFSAASPGLISERYLTGKESVVIKNMTPNGHLAFSLPGARPPICDIEFKHSTKQLNTLLDTVIINVAQMQLQLIWRNYLVLPRGPHDVESIDIRYG